MFTARSRTTPPFLFQITASRGRAAASRPGGAPFEEVGGGESGYVVPDLQDPNDCLRGRFLGLADALSIAAPGSRAILPCGPIILVGAPVRRRSIASNGLSPSPKLPPNPARVYVGGNVVFKSTDQGQSWKAISPDLTRNDPTRRNGGPLEDVYCTVFTIAPSPKDKNIIWAGSDDGLIHITRDAGKTWNDVTPPAIQPWTRINMIEASPQRCRLPRTPR